MGLICLETTIRTILHVSSFWEARRLFSFPGPRRHFRFLLHLSRPQIIDVFGGFIANAWFPKIVKPMEMILPQSEFTL